MYGKPRFAPRDIFEQILEWSVIPTFDLVIENRGEIVLVKRKIAPYKNQWALPGLRMFKGESIDDTLVRIAKQELGLAINPDNRKFLDQYVGRFKTEHQRQDLSTGYFVRAWPNQDLKLNTDHFYSSRGIHSREEIPKSMGSMYKFFLEKYFSDR